MPAHILEKPATVEDVAREVSKIRSIVTDAVEDGVRSARQAFKRLNSSDHVSCDWQVHGRANCVVAEVISFDHRDTWIRQQNIA